MTAAKGPMQPAILTVPVTTHFKSSIFMAGIEFVDRVRNTFDAKDLHLRKDLDLETLEKEIDALCKNMAHRLVCHSQQKVPEQKRNNWVSKFVRSNLRCAVAAMTIMGHINIRRASEQHQNLRLEKHQPAPGKFRVNQQPGGVGRLLLVLRHGRRTVCLEQQGQRRESVIRGMPQRTFESS